MAIKVGDSVTVLYRGKHYGARVIEVKPKIKVKINEGPHANTIVEIDK
jgi:hypothetical protein